MKFAKTYCNIQYVAAQAWLFHNHRQHSSAVYVVGMMVLVVYQLAPHKSTMGGKWFSTKARRDVGMVHCLEDQGGIAACQTIHRKVQQ